MTISQAADSILKSFEAGTGLTGLEYEDYQRNDRLIRVIYVSHVTDRFYSILNESIAKLSEGEELHVTLKQRTRDFVVSGPEGKLLLKVLAESQNINQYSFPKDFFSRYTKSVTGAEAQIVSSASHIVTGRRGAGKSMLLLYCFKQRESQQLPNVWIDLQAYSERVDEQSISDVLAEILRRVNFTADVSDEATSLMHKLESEELTIPNLRRLVPRIRRVLESVSSQAELFIFLDDLHVFPIALQHVLMDVIYATTRGNRIFLKISAIENLVRIYDQSASSGMQIPQDVQQLGLDYNLTTPDKATSHIESILDSHAQYSGLPSIRRLCSSSEVLPRLTWVSAGVPRDAINLFSQAMLKATAEDRKRVTVSNVNLAASDNLSIKLKDLQTDASSSAERLTELLERVRQFCVVQHKANAFLVEKNEADQRFKDVMSLVQLRLLHVISEGITPKEAGKKFVALILDYGLYTGVRAAASVELFNKQTTSVSAKDLRKLKIFR